MRALAVMIGSLFFQSMAGGCRPSTTGPGAAGSATSFAGATTYDATQGTRAPTAKLALLDERPYRRRPALLPSARGPSRARPALVLALHGYGNTSSDVEAALFLDELADAHGYALAIPDGTPDSSGLRFWNAGESCCNFEDHNVDDVAYLAAVIEDAGQRMGTDPSRVYIVGNSNGGFMALRLACELADRVTAVISLAGGASPDVARCRPSRPVSVLQVHGDADVIIPIGGGTSPRLPRGAPFASAMATVTAWGAYDHCTGVLAPAGNVDLIPGLPGRETGEARIAGCPSGVDVELWIVKGGEHTFRLSAPSADALARFLDGAGVPQGAPPSGSAP